MLICVGMCRKKSRTDILGRRCSRVYNVVTVQCILSIILNIYRQTPCLTEFLKSLLLYIVVESASGIDSLALLEIPLPGLVLFP